MVTLSKNEIQIVDIFVSLNASRSARVRALGKVSFHKACEPINSSAEMNILIARPWHDTRHMECRLV